MDWLILVLGVPAILTPLVLLFGFSGCSLLLPARDEEEPEPLVPPSGPTNLVATAPDDRSVSLSWTNTDPAVTDFRIERAEEDGESTVIPTPADLAPGATDTFSGTDRASLQEGVTYIYSVRALLGGQVSNPASETSSATVFPATPVNLAAAPVGIDQINLSWRNVSRTATEISLEHRVPGGAFAEIFRGAGATFSHSGLGEGTQHEYRIVAIVVDGVQADVRQEVRSVPSATVSASTLAFTAAFTASGALTIDGTGNEGFCIVQLFRPTLLIAGGTQVRIVLRGSTTGSLTLDRVAISQVGTTGDPYDSDQDRTDVASNVTIPPNTPVTVGPVRYTLDPTKELLVAFDISNTPGEGNGRFGLLNGADTFASPATAEAGAQDRTTGYGFGGNSLSFVEKIEVL